MAGTMEVTAMETAVGIGGTTAGMTAGTIAEGTIGTTTGGTTGATGAGTIKDTIGGTIEGQTGIELFCLLVNNIFYSFRFIIILTIKFRDPNIIHPNICFWIKRGFS